MNCLFEVAGRPLAVVVELPDELRVLRQDLPVARFCKHRTRVVFLCALQISLGLDGSIRGGDEDRRAMEMVKTYRTSSKKDPRREK